MQNYHLLTQYAGLIDREMILVGVIQERVGGAGKVMNGVQMFT